MEFSNKHTHTNKISQSQVERENENKWQLTRLSVTIVVPS